MLDVDLGRVEVPVMPTVLELELARLRQMTATEKMAVANALWREAWELKRSSIAALHPDWDKTQLDHATREAMTGGGA